MRRFHWRLQRLLDVKEQQEQALRLELVALNQEALELRRQIIFHRSLARTWLLEMRDWPLQRRIDQHGAVMRCVHVAEMRIDALELALHDLKAKRKEKTDELMQVRSRRQTLQRLGEEARQEHLRKELLREQKELDDGAQVAFARKMHQPAANKAG